MININEELEKRLAEYQQTRCGIKARAGSGVWHQESIRYILTNVTYTGDQLWHKTYCTDVLPIRHMRNYGQKPKYFAENCGPTIISKQDFEFVQSMMTHKRESFREGQKNQSPLHKHLYCAECGCLCRRKICRGKPYWICHRRDRKKADCNVPQMPEANITDAVLRFYGRLHFGRDSVLRPMLAQLEELRERELRTNNKISDIDREMARLDRLIDIARTTDEYMQCIESAKNRQAETVGGGYTLLSE